MFVVEVPWAITCLAFRYYSLWADEKLLHVCTHACLLSMAAVCGSNSSVHNTLLQQQISIHVCLSAWLGWRFRSLLGPGMSAAWSGLLHLVSAP